MLLSRLRHPNIVQYYGSETVTFFIPALCYLLKDSYILNNFILHVINKLLISYVQHSKLLRPQVCYRLAVILSRLFVIFSGIFIIPLYQYFFIYALWQCAVFRYFIRLMNKILLTELVYYFITGGGQIIYILGVCVRWLHL
jgi:hypothetical protein